MGMAAVVPRVVLLLLLLVVGPLCLQAHRPGKKEAFALLFLGAWQLFPLPRLLSFLAQLSRPSRPRPRLCLDSTVNGSTTPLPAGCAVGTARDPSDRLPGGKRKRRLVGFLNPDQRLVKGRGGRSSHAPPPPRSSGNIGRRASHKMALPDLQVRGEGGQFCKAIKAAGHFLSIFVDLNGLAPPSPPSKLLMGSPHFGSLFSKHLVRKSLEQGSLFFPNSAGHRVGSSLKPRLKESCHTESDHLGPCCVLRVAKASRALIGPL